MYINKLDKTIGDSKQCFTKELIVRHVFRFGSENDLFYVKIKVNLQNITLQIFGTKCFQNV